MGKESDAIVGRPVKLNKWTADTDEKKLIPIGDLHYGSPQSDPQKFIDTLKYCADSNAWILLMGDLLECATRNSVGAGVYEQLQPLDPQLDWITDTLAPYKDIIIGAHHGNHEERAYKESGINPTKRMCRELGIRYLGWGAFHSLNVQGQRYIVFSAHGASGAVLPHTKIKACLDLARGNDADLYLHAHLHTLDTHTSVYRTYDTRNKIIVDRKRYFALTGSFLNYGEGYAEMKCLPPEKTGVIKVKLFGDRHDIHLSI